MKTIASLFVCALIASCKDTHPLEADSSVIMNPASTLVSSSSGRQTLPQPPKGPLCRAIAVAGGVRRLGTFSIPDAGAINTGDLTGDDYLDLAASSRLSIKNGATSRESIIEGSGAVRVCVGGEEETWLPQGVVTSVASSGEGPGSEAWIITVQGAIRYDAARVHAIASSVRTDITLTSGSASVYPIDGAVIKNEGGVQTGSLPAASEAGWSTLPLGPTVSLLTRRSAAQIVTECEEAAKAAHDLAGAIASRDASLGEAAPRHVVLRHKARAVCAIAELQASRGIDLVERERLLPRARAANALWRN